MAHSTILEYLLASFPPAQESEAVTSAEHDDAEGNDDAQDGAESA